MQRLVRDVPDTGVDDSTSGAAASAAVPAPCVRPTCGAAQCRGGSGAVRADHGVSRASRGDGWAAHARRAGGRRTLAYHPLRLRQRLLCGHCGCHAGVGAANGRRAECRVGWGRAAAPRCGAPRYTRYAPSPAGHGASGVLRDRVTLLPRGRRRRLRRHRQRGPGSPVPHRRAAAHTARVPRAPIRGVRRRRASPGESSC